MNRALDRRRARRLLCLPGALAASIFSLGCVDQGRIRPAAAVELTDRFRPLSPARAETHFDRRAQVTRNGQRRDAMILIAPVSIRASLQGISGNVTLEGWATPVFNVGDGMLMDLLVKRAGAIRSIGSRYFDSGRNAEDRNWIPIALPLNLGEDDQLEIRISAGPQGDLVADWLALSSLRLVQRKTDP